MLPWCSENLRRNCGNYTVVSISKLPGIKYLLLYFMNEPHHFMNEPHHTTDEENYMRPRNSAELSEHLMDKRQIMAKLNNYNV